MKISFIGLGNMGYHIAGHLSNAGHDVTVFNRTLSKQNSWLVQFKGRGVCSAAEAASSAEMLFLCVGTDLDIREVIFGRNGVATNKSLPGIVVDHTTASVAIARELNEMCSSRGAGFVDAPLSGGTAGAKAGTLASFVGGSRANIEKVSPVMSLYCKAVFPIGEAGSGQLAKMANQICIVNNLIGVAEALKFAELNGINASELIPALAKGAAQSWQLENRGPWMVSSKYKDGGFSTDLVIKDLKLCKEVMSASGIHLSAMLNTLRAFEEVSAAGNGRWDFSAIIETIK